MLNRCPRLLNKPIFNAGDAYVSNYGIPVNCDEGAKKAHVFVLCRQLWLKPYPLAVQTAILLLCEQMGLPADASAPKARAGRARMTPESRERAAEARTDRRALLSQNAAVICIINDLRIMYRCF